MPLHKKCNKFLDLLKDVTTFVEFETKVARLDSNKDRGDAFEVFSEAYLSLAPHIQSKTVWPFENLPSKVSSELHLNTPRDMGVDGVFETSNWEYHAYQAKFRSQRSALTWDELSTFMGLSDRVAKRVLITNSNDLPALMNDRSGFYCIRGHDLDRLGSDDFSAMYNWLKNGGTTRVLKKPRSHQSEAVDRVVNSLSTNSRTTLVMACGSGKTLVPIWVAEKIEAKRLLLLFPSLALLKQTFHEWHQQSRTDLRSLCVCSDPTVANSDQIQMQQADLDFSVTTQAEDIREFVERDSEQFVIFSTYQSAAVVGAALRDEVKLDLGVFDEAHKTAGRDGTRFSFALSDRNLPISKRLFMTATPRNYAFRKHGSAVKTKLVYSMDDKSVFGPTAHRLNFSEAAERKIICNYKVVISVVTKAMLGAEMRRRGEVIVDADVIKLQQVANQIALKKALEKTHAKKVISFHSSVKSAQSFVSRGAEGIGSHIHDLRCFHVNGSQTTAVRDRLISEFRQAERAIVSNARCLTEGVDVPVVDMVAFLSPKKSRVDIVQAVGRAMRSGSGKEIGYVFVPLFLEEEEEETIQSALERTNFSDVWEVLRAMQDHDSELSDTITELKAERGRSQHGYDDSRLREKIEYIGPELQLADIESSVTARIVENFGVEWMPFLEARKFVQELGLQNADQYKFEYCRGLMPELPQKPLGIPNSPHAVYRDAGWVNWGDWLGTGNVLTKEWVPFEEARRFARTLGLKTAKQWVAYVRAGMLDLPDAPGEIPSRPDGVYGKEWISWSDFLGSKFQRNVQWREFSEAREFARSLELKNSAEWSRFCKGERGDLPPLPNDIPAAPGKPYKDQWQGWGDWLGTGFISNSQREYLTYQEAQKYVSKLGLKTTKDWNEYVRRTDQLPSHIPKAPWSYYSDEWKGMSIWLGTSDEVTHWLSFEEARDYARSLNLKYRKDWMSIARGENPKLMLPPGIPANPESFVKYRDEWISWKDWLGIVEIPTRDFSDARAFVRALGLKSKAAWTRYCRGEEKGYEDKPDDIPSNPHTVYKERGWTSYKDWIGSSDREYASFAEARFFSRKLGLKGPTQWRRYCSGQYSDLPRLPEIYPRNPQSVFKNEGWLGWPDFLGYQEKADYVSYEEARHFARSLDFYSSQQWAKFVRGDQKRLPPSIPKGPQRYYQGKGWVSWQDFLGNASRKTQTRRTFEEAKKFVRNLELHSRNEWEDYVAGRINGMDPLPKDIPRKPREYYKGEWGGWGDFLGTGNVANFNRDYLPFEEARSFVRSLGLSSNKQWEEYIKGLRPDLPQKPRNIPNQPRHVYREKGWISIPDWLGYDKSTKS